MGCIGRLIITEKPKCFGEWLDTCYKGYPKCRTCEYLKECIEKFKKDLKK